MVFTENFCWAPWTDVTLEPNGEIKPCCVYNGNLGTYKTASDLKNVLQHPELIQLRQNFLDGKKPEGCATCFREESRKAPSKRQKISTRLQKRGFPIETLPLIDSRDHFRHMDISFSNTCNLTCVMCNGRNSSSWRKLEQSFEEEVGLHRDPSGQKFRVSLEDIPELVQLSHSVSSVQVLGGEPLMEPAFRAYLRDLALLNPDCDLSIATNGTYFDQEIFDLLEAFKRGCLDFSLDGIGKTYEYVRGTSFSKVSEQIEKACFLRPEILIAFNFTLSLYNAFNLAETIQWIADLCSRHPDRKIKLFLNQVVTSPPQMSPLLLPKSAREQIIAQLEQCKNRPFLSAHDLNAIIAFLRTSPPTDHITEQELRAQSLRSTAYFNRLRGFSIWDIEPRFTSYRDLEQNI